MDVFDLFAKISIDLSDFEKGLNQAKTKAESFAKNVSGLSSNISSVYSGVKDVLAPAVDGFKAVESVGKTAGNAVMNGLKGFAAAATAVGGFGTAAVKSGMAFDATMSEVSAISGAAGQDFQDLRDKALEMGAKTKFSASEAADAMTYMGMAGWKAQDMIGGIEGIMDLAAASGENLATTSDIVTDALTAFGKSASDSGHLADIMAAASSNANTNVSMLGESFKYVAPVAGALGYTMEDTSLALGLMANSGIKASQAGTSLRTAMTNMASPTKNMASVMKKYDLSLTNTDGSMKSLVEVMDELRLKMGDVDEATQAADASLLFGKEAMSGMLAIINASTEDYKKLAGAIYECDGAAKQMASTMIDNLQGDLTLLGSAFESLQIAISDSLTPTLREFAQFGQKAMAELLKGFQGNGVTGFMNALEKIVADGIALLSSKAPEFAKVSVQFLEAIANGILQSRDKIVDTANQIFTMLITELDSWLSKHLPELLDFGKKIVDSLFKGFVSAGEIISKYIGEFIPLIAEAFAKYHESIFKIGMDILGAIGEGIVKNKEEIAKIASETIANMVTSFKENAPKIIDGAVALIKALVSGLKDNIPLIKEAAIEVIPKFISGVLELLPDILDVAAEIIVALGEGLVASLPELVARIPEIIAAFVSTVVEHIPDIISLGGQIIAGLIEGLIKAIPELIMAIPKIGGALVDGFKNFFGIHSPSTVFAEIGENMMLGMKNGISDESVNLISEASSVAAASLEAFAGLSSELGETGEGMMLAMKMGISNENAALMAQLASVVKASAEAFSGLSSEFFGIGQNAMNSLASSMGAGISALQSKVSGLMSGIASAAKAALGIHSPSKVFAGIGENMALGLGEGWDDEYSDIKRKITSGLNFGTTSIGLAGTYSAPRAGQNGPQTGFGGAGNTYVTINSPIAVDAVQAAREWKKTAQRMAMGYV